MLDIVAGLVGGCSNDGVDTAVPSSRCCCCLTTGTTLLVVDDVAAPLDDGMVSSRSNGGRCSFTLLFRPADRSDDKPDGENSTTCWSDSDTDDDDDDDDDGGGRFVLPLLLLLTVLETTVCGTGGGGTGAVAVVVGSCKNDTRPVPNRPTSPTIATSGCRACVRV